MIIPIHVYFPNGDMWRFHSSQVPRQGDEIDIFDPKDDYSLGVEYVVQRVLWLFSPKDKDTATEVALYVIPKQSGVTP